MSIKERSRSVQTDVSTYYSAVVGDLDGDGFGEIVIPGGTHNSAEHLYIFNYKAELIRKIDLPEEYTMITGDDSVLLVDFDNDGKGEIVVTASKGKEFFIYDFSGNLLARASHPTTFPKTMGVADFNNDGIPELYIGTRIYSFSNGILTLMADGGNAQQSTMAQDIDGDGIPELVGVDTSYKVVINSLSNPLLNSIIPLATCSNISVIDQQRERTFALADIDLDGTIDVITVVPIASPVKKLEVKVWNPLTGNVIYDIDLEMNPSIGGIIRNSWPFIGDTDGNKYPDIIFMGGLNTKGHTSIYRVEYDEISNTLIERAKNSTYDDNSSMSTSMSMFDFNNDGKQEIVYRDESSLYIINGENLMADITVPDCYSGTGWEYPVVASLAPSGESSIIMCSGEESSGLVTGGTLRIYGADTGAGAKPWMPARRVWNQHSFYQNTIYDDLTIIPNPASLNTILTSTDGKGTTMQPFNGHMTQLGIIKPSTLESIHPLANVGIDITNIAFGFNRVEDKLTIEFDVSNTGSAAMDPKIPINVFKYLDDNVTTIYSDNIDQVFYPDNMFSIDIDISSFEQYYPLDSLVVHIAKDKYDCDTLNNKFTIYPENISGVLYVKKGNTGEGSTWQDAMGELSDALQKATAYNARYPYSLTQIWLATGTYEGNFEMLEGVNVHGGFAGNETDFALIDTVANKTYVDARGMGRVLTQANDFATPTEWAGLILQKRFESAIDHDVYGGGAYLRRNGSLRYSTIRNSKAVATSIHNKVNAYGGGVYMGEGASLLNSIIDNNIAEVNNTKPATIQSGVAQGGGVNNVNNRLAYLIVRNNKTISGGNTDGSAIYSTGDVVNNVANNNKGKSAIYIAANRNIINNTIVANEGEHTIVGETNSLLKNSIIFDNKATAGDFKNVDYSTYKNLINIDPIFETNSFRLSTSSPASAIGDPTFFPADLTLDMENKKRVLSLKDNAKVIDAGAYQSKIKVVSAIETMIEVPFGTDFSSISFKDLITGLLKLNYEFDATVTWLESIYNKHKDGDYLILGNLSDLGEDIINPDNVKGQITIRVKKNNIADLDALSIDGVDWLPNLGDTYTVDCCYTSNTLPITLALPHFATIKTIPEVKYTQVDNDVTIDLDITRAGTHTLDIAVTSQDGSKTISYPITIVKYFPFWEIIEQRWNNSFVINNNQETNGNYQFVSYKWYKNGMQIGTKQYYSAGDYKTDLLDESSLYHATMVDVNGVEYETCKDSPVLMSSSILISPGAVRAGESLRIEIPLKDNQTAKVNVYSLAGIPIKEEALPQKVNTIQAPTSSGIYIVKVSIAGGVSESLRIVVY